jgi:hypothetical protein
MASHSRLLAADTANYRHRAICWNDKFRRFLCVRQFSICMPSGDEFFILGADPKMAE